jgi:ribonuclease D
VETGLAAEVTMPAAEGEELERHMRPAVALVSAWVGEVARKQRVDAALLATRTDLVSFLRGDETSRLAHGWRNEFLGDGIRRLVEGRSALTFDGRGGLRLVDVTPEPAA